MSIATDVDSPARKLTGKTLRNGWNVVELIKRPPNATGGCFSASYLVRSDNGRKAFLKAMDYREALGSEEPAIALQRLTQVYNFERNVLEKCKSRRLSRVVTILDVGKIDGTPNDPSSVVEYLIFELADGDIRSYAPDGHKIELAWVLRRLHQVAAALRQLHYCGIAHQDIKPSNVLVFDNEDLKLADLGRASDRGNASPFDTFDIAGDQTYAPPELLYGEIPNDWGARRLACDIYLMGSMAMYFFAGTSMTHLLLKRLGDDLHPTSGQRYRDIMPYIEHEFSGIIREIKDRLPERYSSELSQALAQLCNPDPDQRGHPKNLVSKDSSVRYSVERYISLFELLAKRAEYERKRTLSLIVR